MRSRTSIPRSVSRRPRLPLSAPSRLLSLPGELRVERLENGLTVALFVNRQAPLVTSALYFRAGTRDESGANGGVAHFLEHMMFKGSAAYGPGEIDRVTQSLGGANNAFTGHDATTYYFNFAADRWTRALEIETDRMSALALEAEAVASERQVILEELAMYESEPWDALEVAVHGRLFAAHPYGQPVLGSRESLGAIDGGVLRDFHERFYRPDNAVLVVAGDIDPEAALGEVERTLGSLPPGAARRAPPSEAVVFPSGMERVEKRKGEIGRLMLALPGPAATHSDHPPLRLASILLGGSRMSRLQRALVDEEKLCAWLTADLSDGMDASFLTIAGEVVPEVEPERVEARVLELLAELFTDPPSDEELDRSRRIAHADWVFEHEKLHQQALSLGQALALFDLDHLDLYIRQVAETSRDRLLEVADRYLRPERGGVLGWSLPKP